MKSTLQIALFALSIASVNGVSSDSCPPLSTSDCTITALDQPPKNIRCGKTGTLSNPALTAQSGCHVTSDTQCRDLCVNKVGGCISFGYNQETSECRMFTKPIRKMGWKPTNRFNPPDGFVYSHRGCFSQTCPTAPTEPVNIVPNPSFEDSFTPGSGYAIPSDWPINIDPDSSGQGVFPGYCTTQSPATDGDNSLYCTRAVSGTNTASVIIDNLDRTAYYTLSYDWALVLPPDGSFPGDESNFIRYPQFKVDLNGLNIQNVVGCAGSAICRAAGDPSWNSNSFNNQQSAPDGTMALSFSSIFGSAGGYGTRLDNVKLIKQDGIID